MLPSEEIKEIHWSAEKLNYLHRQLVGPWASDIWQFNSLTKPGTFRYLRFAVAMSSLKIELKFAVWKKFDSGQRMANKENQDLWTNLNVIIRWLNSFTPPIQSLMEKDIEPWVLLFRSHLAQFGQIRYRMGKILLASQEYSEYRKEDERILLLRQLYSSIRDAYEYSDRPETEKDCWDMRKMDLQVNLARGQRHLNFTLISQPWLRHLAKEFMKYRITKCNAGDCIQKIKAIGSFSQFLETSVTGSSVSDINRALIIKYISFLQARNMSERSRASTLGALRVFLETCAQRLCIEEVPKERMIFDDDLPKWRTGPSREIPEEVLEQLKKHLEALDTIMLRGFPQIR